MWTETAVVSEGHMTIDARHWKCEIAATSGLNASVFRTIFFEASEQNRVSEDWLARRGTAIVTHLLSVVYEGRTLCFRVQY